jgi:hypothetical protein
MYLGNILFGSPSPGQGFQVVDPGLERMGDVLSIAAGSPAVDAAAGSYPFVTDDVHGQPRSKPDVGADEWSSSPPQRRVLTAADVGPDAP